MPFDALTLEVLIASPGDVTIARDAIEAELQDWNSAYSKDRNVSLQPRRWEIDSVPLLAQGDAQSVINAQIVDEADIVLVVFHARLGTPTSRAASGTAEELVRTSASGKPVHVYFSRQDNPNDVDTRQLESLREFETHLAAKNLVGDFRSLEELRRKVRRAVEYDVRLLRVSRAHLPTRPGRSPMTGGLTSPTSANVQRHPRTGEAQLGPSVQRLSDQVVFKHDGPVNAISFSPEGGRLATASADGTARVWDSTSGRALRKINVHKTAVWAVAFSPDGYRLATGSCDNAARVWEIEFGRELAKMAHRQDILRTGGCVYGVAFSPDGKRLATAGSDETARVWNPREGRELFKITPNTFSGRLIAVKSIFSVSFSPDGGRLATAGFDGTARVWNSTTGAELTRLNHDSDVVRAATFSPDGTSLVTASKDGTARVWDSFSGRELARMDHPDSVLAATFSPDGSEIATGSVDGKGRVWSINGKEMRRIVHPGAVRDVAFSPDGTLLASACRDGSARLWVL